MYRVPTVFSVTLVNPAQEYPQALPDGTRFVEIQCTTAVDNSFSFVTGGPYMPIKANSVYQSFPLSRDPKTLYFYTAAAGAIMRVLCHPYPVEGEVPQSGQLGI